MRSFYVFLLLTLVLVAGCMQPDAVDVIADGPEVVLVPVMRERPVLDKELGAAEWAEAALVEGEFVIANGTRTDGTYPFRLRLGVDEKALHVALELPDLPPNPWSGNISEGGGLRGDNVCLVFVNGHEGAFGSPAARFCIWVIWEVGSGAEAGYWTGSAWSSQDVKGADFNEGRPEGGRWARQNVTQNGTAFWEAYLSQTSGNPKQDGVQLRPGGAFRMSLMFVRGGDPDNPECRCAYSPNTDISNPHDVWPGEGYTPENRYDTTTWLKLRAARL